LGEEDDEDDEDEEEAEPGDPRAHATGASLKGRSEAVRP